MNKCVTNCVINHMVNGRTYHQPALNSAKLCKFCGKRNYAETGKFHRNGQILWLGSKFRGPRKLLSLILVIVDYWNLCIYLIIGWDLNLWLLNLQSIVLSATCYLFIFAINVIELYLSCCFNFVFCRTSYTSSWF